MELLQILTKMYKVCFLIIMLGACLHQSPSNGLSHPRKALVILKAQLHRAATGPPDSDFQGVLVLPFHSVPSLVILGLG